MADLRIPDINRVMLAGRLTRDPELKYTPAGLALCKFGLAISRFYKGKDGERKEDTTFVEVTVWDKQGEYCGQHLKQGRPVLVEGRLHYDAWDDKTTGQKRSKLDVQAQRVQELAWEDRGGAGAAPRPETRPESRSESRPIEEPIPEDDIPF